MKLTEKFSSVPHANAIFHQTKYLLDAIDKHKHNRKQAKFSFSISGVFLEQCEMFDQDLLETFQATAQTGCVEFLNQTYYHSISSLYPDKEEFIEQAKMHKQTVKDLLGYTPKFLRTRNYSTTIQSPKPLNPWVTKASTLKGLRKFLAKNLQTTSTHPKAQRKFVYCFETTS